jgi:hypothetical protein
VGFLVEASAKANEVAGIGEALQIDKRDAGSLKVARAHNPPSPGDVEGALAISHMTFGQGVIYCRQKPSIVDEREQLGNFS